MGDGTYLARPAPSGLADVIDIVLNRGIVIDAHVRVSLLGVELLTIDARAVVASVDTYLRFAEATNRLDLSDQGDRTLLDVFEEGAGALIEHTAAAVVEKKVERAKETVAGAVEGAVETVVDKVADAGEALLPDQA